MSNIEICVRPKYGPAIEHQDGRYHCLARTKQGNPCKNITHWFYRPQNSDLCLTHIRMYERRRTP